MIIAKDQDGSSRGTTWSQRRKRFVLNLAALCQCPCLLVCGEKIREGVSVSVVSNPWMFPSTSAQGVTYFQRGLLECEEILMPGTSIPKKIFQV